MLGSCEQVMRGFLTEATHSHVPPGEEGGESGGERGGDSGGGGGAVVTSLEYSGCVIAITFTPSASEAAAVFVVRGASVAIAALAVVRDGVVKEVATWTEAGVRVTLQLAGGTLISVAKARV